MKKQIEILNNSRVIVPNNENGDNNYVSKGFDHSGR